MAASGAAFHCENQTGDWFGFQLGQPPTASNSWKPAHFGAKMVCDLPVVRFSAFSWGYRTGVSVSVCISLTFDIQPSWACYIVTCIIIYQNFSNLLVGLDRDFQPPATRHVFQKFGLLHRLDTRLLRDSPHSQALVRMSRSIWIF